VRIINVASIGIVGISAFAAAVYEQATPGASANLAQAEASVDANGNLRVPADYRTAYQFLGSWAIAGAQGQGVREIHVVYASPGTITAYRKDGLFPDGSVLVKEVYQATTGQMTTGTVSRPGVLEGWFVMVKNSKGRYAGNKLWGDGWGWSWFDAANPSKTTSTDYRANCLSCHVPAKASDWVYVSGYPPLKQ
jgi:hypothetical protein